MNRITSFAAAATALALASGAALAQSNSTSPGQGGDPNTQSNGVTSGTMKTDQNAGPASGAMMHRKPMHKAKPAASAASTAPNTLGVTSTGKSSGG